MSRRLVEARGRCVNQGLVNGPFPLTPALSLGERETRGSVRLTRSFIVPMKVPWRLKLTMNRRANMPLLRSLGKDQGTLAAIDVALLRSFSSRVMVLMHVRSARRLCMKRIEDDDEDDAAAGLRHSRGPWKCRFMVPMKVP